MVFVKMYLFFIYCILPLLVIPSIINREHSESTYSIATSYEDSYKAVGGLPRNLSWSELASVIGEGSDMASCQTVGVYTLQRHGITYPEESVITTFMSLFSRIRKMSSINPEFAYLREEPQDRFTRDKAERLTDEGFNEIMGISSRLVDRLFSSLRDAKFLIFSDSSFQTTETNRTKETAEAFISGLCEGCRFRNPIQDEDKSIRVTKYGILYTEISWLPICNDPLLAPKCKCQIYNDFIALKEPFREYNNFRNGPFVEGVRFNVELLISGSNDFNMSLDELKALYEICVTEIAIFGVSHWCNLFSQSDIRVMEYMEDLKEYWYSSYGYPINYRPYCVLLQDITSYLQSAVVLGNDQNKMFKFAHSTTIQGLLALFGFYRPSVIPTADNYPLDGDWDYRGAIISPYAANIDFALFQCSDTTTSRNTVGQFKVLVTHNEQPVKLGACDSYFCDLGTLMSYFESKVGSCDFDQICGRPNPPEPTDESF